MKATIDRFEDKFAILEFEDGTFKNIKIEILPEGAKEGDILKIVGNSMGIDSKEIKERKRKINKLLNELLE